MKLITSIILFTLTFFSMSAQVNPPANLRCEGNVNPMAIENIMPALSWVPEITKNGVAHESWQVQAASSMDKIRAGKPDLWDSRWQPYKGAWHAYRGKTLKSYEPCYWRVRTRTKDRQVSDWSEPAMFRMGVLSPEEWRGSWIGYSEPLPGIKPGPTARDLHMRSVQWIWAEEQAGDIVPFNTSEYAPARYMFSREFESSTGNPDWAVLRLAVDGANTYIAINGKMVKLIPGNRYGENWLIPLEIDVKESLKKGTNRIDVSIRKRYNSPGYGFQAILLFREPNGEIRKITTDNTWSAVHEPEGSARKLRFTGDGAVPRMRLRYQDLSWGQEKTNPMLRRSFEANSKIRSAIVTVSGLGFYELSLNGKRVGDRIMDPAFTNYDKRVLYSSYDVTGSILKGENVLGLMLGNGWYNQTNFELLDFDIAAWRDDPKALVQLRIEYEDGRVSWVVSDEDWKGARSPVVLDGIRNGEVYDARLEQPGWNRPGFNDSSWKKAIRMKAPSGKMVAMQMPPERIVELLTADEITETENHNFIFKFPRNTSGWPRLKVSGPKGTRVVMYCYEVDDKRLDSHVTRQGPFQTDTYILKGEGVEYYEPKFSYHGFQYIEVTGYPGEPDKESLKMAVVHTDFETAGDFVSSSPLLNSIQAATRNAFLSNYHGYPTDCPTREKGGWTADGYLAAETGLLNFKSHNAYSKWLNDMLDCQDEDGRIPDIAPTSVWGYNGKFDWDCGVIYLPWYVYLYTGDSEMLTRSYTGMKACYGYYFAQAKKGILNNGRGDWSPYISVVPKAVTLTAMLADCARILSITAGILKNTKEQALYKQKENQVKEAFVREFLRDDGTISNGCQTAQSCALYFNLVPESMRPAVVAKLVEAVHKANDHIDFGIFGSKYVFSVLSENGHHQLAGKVIMQETYPGYGWWVLNGFTSLPESWSTETSLNHIMFGDISAWFYRNLAGIKPMEKAPGFKEFLLEPRVNIDLDHVDASHESPYGTIRSSWKKEGNEVEYRFEVPTNTMAHIILEGEPLIGPAMIRTGANNYTASLGSGIYVFRMKQ